MAHIQTIIATFATTIMRSFSHTYIMLFATGARHSTIRLTLLATALALASAAHAETATFIAPDATGSGTALVNADGGHMQDSNHAEATSLIGESFSDHGLTIAFPPAPPTPTAPAPADQVRFTKADTIRVPPPEGTAVSHIECTTVQASKGPFEVGTGGAATGTLAGDGKGAGILCWTGYAEGTFTIVALDQVRFSSISFTFSAATGIASIEADDNAPVEFFTLQGTRIDKPEAGRIVIRRQGGNVCKMLVR